jgi:hypothetical protein
MARAFLHSLVPEKSGICCACGHRSELFWPLSRNRIRLCYKPFVPNMHEKARYRRMRLSFLFDNIRLKAIQLPLVSAAGGRKARPYEIGS